MISSINQNTTTKYNESIPNVALAGVAAMSTYAIGKKVTRQAALHSHKLLSNFTETDIIKLNNAADSALATSGLKDKGVKIVHLSKQAKPDVNLPKHAKEKFEGIKNGKNASFEVMTEKVKGKGLVIKSKNIYVNRSLFPLPIFHEMGHAQNYEEKLKNMSPETSIGKHLKHFKHSVLKNKKLNIAVLCAMCALTSKKEAKEGEKLSFKDKLSNGIRNLAPVAAFGMYVPTLVEEAKATIKGAKLVPKEFLPIYKKSTTAAFASYALAAATAGLSVFATKKVKDKIDELNK